MLPTTQKFMINHLGFFYVMKYPMKVRVWVGGGALGTCFTWLPSAVHTCPVLGSHCVSFASIRLLGFTSHVVAFYVP